MKWLLPILFAFLFQQLPELEVKPLSFDAKDFKEAFNASAGEPRLVGIFSPSCGHCLRACSELQEILNRHPKGRLRVFLMWAPFMQRDTLNLAKQATGYLPDERVQHYWDLWRFTSRAYAKQMEIPELHAWDMFVFYKPHLVWHEIIPEPTFWMQNRDLDLGTPYSQDDLEAGLIDWMQ
jgi:hypothetical protein